MPVGEETHTRWDCQQQRRSEGKTGDTEHTPEVTQKKSKQARVSRRAAASTSTAEHWWPHRGEGQKDI